MEQDRRNSERVACGLELMIELPGAPFRATIMNISKAGMFLRASLASPLESLRLTAALRARGTVQLTLQRRGGLAPAEARGVIAWKSDLGVGITFSEVNNALNSFIAELTASPAALAHVLPPATLDLDPLGAALAQPV